MSRKSTWHTKEDILQDLVVMGQMTNIDEGYLVTGEKPPPPRLELEDDEMDLRFGGISNDGYPYRNEQPDLQGITQFLRMVNDDDSHPKELPDDEIVIIKPGIKSNLDPTVAEFIPKNVVSNSSSVVSSKNNISDNEKPKTNGVSAASDKKTSTDINLNKVDITQLNRKEKDDITAKLRDKISDTLRADTPQLKKERNVAIANLIKLHSSKPRPSTSAAEPNTDNAIKLLTPDYYKRSAKFSPPSSNTERSTPNKDLKKTRMNESNSATPEPILNGSSTEHVLDSSSNVHVLDSSSNVPVLDSSSNEPVLDSSSSATNIQAIDSSMEESIKKVNNWFEQPESPRPKALAVCLGPISFKKKDPNHAKSPTNDTEQKRKQTTAVYRPSKYADDLGKKYLERSKVKEAQSGDIWTRLEKQLKARDAEIKKKQKATETTERPE